MNFFESLGSHCCICDGPCGHVTPRILCQNHKKYLHMVEALKFYADHRTWVLYNASRRIDIDYADKAREALKLLND